MDADWKFREALWKRGLLRAEPDTEDIKEATEDYIREREEEKETAGLIVRGLAAEASFPADAQAELARVYRELPPRKAQERAGQLVALMRSGPGFRWLLGLDNEE